MRFVAGLTGARFIFPQRASLSVRGWRPWGSALYFLVTTGAQIVLHRIRSDQLYHHYVGDPLDVLMLLYFDPAHRRLTDKEGATLLLES